MLTEPLCKWNASLEMECGTVWCSLLGVFALIVGSALFCLVLAIFYGIGTLVGESLQAAGPPLQAYTLNLAGSLVGTLAFTALVFFSLPP